LAQNARIDRVAIREESILRMQAKSTVRIGNDETCGAVAPLTLAVASRRRWRLGVGLLVAVVMLAGIASPPVGLAVAQGWQWPWSQPERPPVPREPVYRDRAPAAPPPVVQPGRGSSVCLQLEQRLVQESQRGGQARDQLPRLDGDIRQARRQLAQSQAALDRADCYEWFLFAKSLRRTRRCVDLSRQVEDTQRRLQDLENQRQQVASSEGRSYQDEIVRELARNNCGSTYQQEAARRSNDFNPFSSFWQDGESQGGGGAQFGRLPFATYRTICVRLCDGYYFPVSFSTLPNHFQRDAEACQSKCAAPSELYYYPNPGGSLDQAMSVNEQKPYSSLRTAFKYRKELVAGCSCKQAEFVPSTDPQAGRKRADASPASPSSSSWAASPDPRVRRPIAGR
jgi:hypothetical protein